MTVVWSPTDFAKERGEPTEETRSVAMTINAIEKASEAYKGFCIKCGKITRADCEPDARHYPCPRCKTDSVFGIEEAVMMGAIAVK